MIRQRILSTTRKPSARAVSGSLRRRGSRRKQDSQNQKSVILITFFDVTGIVHSEFLPQGLVISQQVYKEILRCLLRSVREKRRELWQDKSWLLHHDNAPVHNALSIRQFLGEKNIAVLEQPPYSPDLAPCDFFFSPSSRGSSRGPVLKAWRPSREPLRRS